MFHSAARVEKTTVTQCFESLPLGGRGVEVPACLLEGKNSGRDPPGRRRQRVSSSKGTCGRDPEDRLTRAGHSPLTFPLALSWCFFGCPPSHLL